MFTDRMLKCAECAVEFVFTTAEQQFWEERAFRFPPRRCRDCRRKRRDSGADGTDHASERPPRAERAPRPERPQRDASGAPRESHPATCSQCGGVTTVPFKPDPARATFCRDCYSQRNRR